MPGVQADGIRVGDEVDFVAARGEFQPKLGGDDAAAAVGGIAGDADLHMRSVACRHRRDSSERNCYPTGRTRGKRTATLAPTHASVGGGRESRRLRTCIDALPQDVHGRVP